MFVIYVLLRPFIFNKFWNFFRNFHNSAEFLKSIFRKCVDALCELWRNVQIVRLFLANTDLYIVIQEFMFFYVYFLFFENEKWVVTPTSMSLSTRDGSYEWCITENCEFKTFGDLCRHGFIGIVWLQKIVKKCGSLCETEPWCIARASIPLWQWHSRQRCNQFFSKNTFKKFHQTSPSRKSAAALFGVSTVLPGKLKLRLKGLWYY